MRILSILSLAASFCVLISCGPNRNTLQDNIEQAESALESDEMILTDTAAVLDLVKQYDLFVKHFANDSLAPVYLYRSADLMIAIDNPDDAAERLDRIISQYPDFSDMPYCLFFKGFALEQANRIDEAIVAYQEFLKRYPDHFFADGLRTVLPLMQQGLGNDEQLDYILSHPADSNAAPLS